MIITYIINDSISLNRNDLKPLINRIQKGMNMNTLNI